MRKVIGIVGSKVEGGFGAGIANLEYISKFGDPHIIMPWEEFNPNLDMVYLPGGLDVNPGTYGHVPSFKTSHTDVYKQFFLDHRLHSYVDAKTPIFGVCLGFQQLNVFFGGTLLQDNPYHPNSPERGVAGHTVTTTEGWEFPVNSHHHQCVTKASLSHDLMQLAKMTGKSTVVEAFQHKELPIVGVQWHPEEWFDDFCDLHIKALLTEGRPALPHLPKRVKAKEQITAEFVDDLPF